MDNQKMVSMLIWSEDIFDRMKTNYRDELRHSLDDCWAHLESKTVSPEELYHRLDDGTDFGGIFIWMQMESEAGEVLQWDSISYALASITFAAYKNQNQLPLPATLENIDSSVYELFIDNLNKIDKYFGRFIEKIAALSQENAVISGQKVKKELRNMGLLS